ncbi:RNA 2'-phosphotransferase [Thalassovita sp.]|uniref:RNA 2'-phosphotransferase n=1 Tax=Thalassovita sp. TaxID=1979401 RepID=UPI0029DE7CBC|nr:RNA 2'-phosphotransferase [Thalassovita sp.]
MTAQQAIPPDTLYFGTSVEAATLVLVQGLIPEDGRYVHLAPDPATARQHGGSKVFSVYARTAHDEGQAFWLSDNGVWLTGPVDPEFLYLPPIRGAE